MKEINKTIGLKIKELRAEKGYTLEQVADKTGLSGQMIFNYESHKHEPGPKNLKKLADLFGVTVGYIKGEASKNLEKLIDEKASGDDFYRDKYNEALKENEILFNKNRGRC